MSTAFRNPSHLQSCARAHGVAGIAALPFLLALSAGCSKHADNSAPKASPPMAVSVTPAREREVERTIIVSGPIAAVEEMQLGVEVSGLRVTGLYVEVGQSVHRGELLLELDARTLDSDLARARAALDEADTAASLAQANVRRAEPLASDRYISAGQLDELRAARAQAKARVTTARAALDAAQLRRDFARLRAPADGIVSKRLVQPGQVVAAGTALLRLIRDGRLEWRAELGEAELAQVAEGDPVAIATRDGTVTGRVRAISPGVDPGTRTGTVYADLPPTAGLRSGAYLEGRIRTGSARTLVVPAEAIVTRDGNPFVFTVDSRNTARRVRVRTGPAAGDFVPVIDGIQPGTRVITEGAGFVGEGDAVRIVPATNAASGAAAP
jgi:RND family efflux transporter MFP subunit